MHEFEENILIYETSDELSCFEIEVENYNNEKEFKGKILLEDNNKYSGEFYFEDEILFLKNKNPLTNKKESSIKVNYLFTKHYLNFYYKDIFKYSLIKVEIIEEKD